VSFGVKKLLLGTSISLAMVAGAAAADLPPAPPPAPAPVPYTKAPPPALSWTGCYVGGNIGGGWSHISASDTNTNISGDLGTINGSGFVGGGQVGCDYQFAGRWVVGVTGEFEGARIKGSVPFAPERANTSTIPWLATATVRLGVAIQPATLVYVRGGGA
jgi:outer membrane immunogenic protein